MKPEWRRVAPLGLLLSLLAGLTTAGLYFVFRTWGLPVQISLGLTIIGLALYAILNPEGVRAAFTGRQARYGSNALVLTVAFVGILVVINWLAYRAAELYPENTRWDLTEDKNNSLAAETLDVLGKLEQPVSVQAFFTERAYSKETARSLLDRFKTQGKGQFSYEFIDPDEKPQAFRDAGIAQDKDGVLYLQMGERHEIVETISEQALTSGLYRLMAGESRTVYFLTGHGEHNPEGSGEEALSKARTALQNKNYTVQMLNLRTSTVIPEDADVIVVAGPVNPLGENEVSMLAGFLAQGGALIVLQDPWFQTEFGNAPDPLAEYLLANWGIQYGNDVILQMAANQPSEDVTAVQVAQDHPIVASILQNNPPVFSLAQSIQAARVISSITLTELIQSSPYLENCYPACSWATTNLENPLEASQVGPVTMAVVGENADTQGKVVVFGDADFAINVYFQAYGNDDLFLSSVDWASGQEDLIDLTMQPATQRFLVPPWSIDITRNLMMLIAIFVLPGSVFVLGLLNWLARRRRG